MKIAGREISSGQPAFIIAEIGLNHNGDRELAKRHIEAAAKTGVDAVKFQTFKAEKLVNAADPRCALMRGCELPYEWHEPLKKLTESLGLVFLSSAFDEESADFLDRLGVSGFKLASGDLTHLPLLEHVAGKGKPVLMSTGYSNRAEILAARDVLAKGKGGYAFLHCVSSYPTQDADLNLRTISWLQTVCPVAGFSDHSENAGVVAAAARALGACIFEKHFTLDRALKGFDHAMSADPALMTQYVRTIRDVETALGGERQDAFAPELKKILNARRGVYWARALPAGAKISAADLKIVRPAAELKPVEARRLVGRKVKTAVAADAPVKAVEIEGA